MYNEGFDRTALLDALKEIKQKIQEKKNLDDRIAACDKELQGYREDLKGKVNKVHKTPNASAMKKAEYDKVYKTKAHRACAILATIGIIVLIAFAVFSTIYLFDLYKQFPEKWAKIDGYHIMVPILYAVIGLIFVAVIWGKVSDCASTADEKQVRKTAVICVVLALVLCGALVGGGLFVIGDLIPSQRYEKAVALEKQGKYYEAYLLYEKNSKHEESVARKDTIREKAYIQQYDAAMADYQAGNYAAALEKFKWLGDYQDSVSYVQKIPKLATTESIRTANVGDEVRFGTKNDEKIAWFVLAKEGDRALILSVSHFGIQDYHDYTMSGPAWDGCTLRDHLNEEFLGDYFSEAEQQSICVTTVPSAPNPVYGTDGGSDTEDKVFLLSVEEVETYLQDPRMLGCRDEKGNTLRWWLRNPGERRTLACTVLPDGTINYEGCNIISFGGDDSYVRPAMWVDISK